LVFFIRNNKEKHKSAKKKPESHEGTKIVKNQFVDLRALTSIGRSPLGGCLPVIALLSACFVLSPPAQAVSPAPDGGYPGNNTAEGQDALFSLASNITDNTAIGYHALYNDTNGFLNTAVGSLALFSLTGGNNNTASGYKALYSTTTGHDNTANGAAALQNNTSDANTANGAGALAKNTTGDSNTADGYRALTTNTTGADNIALGYYAGSNLTTGSDNIDIGNSGVAGESNTIRIGEQGTQAATYVAGIYGVTTSGGAAVYINASGKLGTATSSARFKSDIRSMDKASEAILAMRPVTFRYKQELDPEGIAQFGLVAEDVEKVSPALVVHDADGKPYTVCYEAVNAMLLNEFLKEHKAFLEEQSRVQKLEALLEGVNERLKDQEAKIQKVSANLEVSELRPPDGLATVHKALLPLQ
jgi:hypothetical protein